MLGPRTCCENGQVSILGSSIILGMKDCDLESLDIIESGKFHGFSKEEVVIVISSASNLLLDKLVVEEAFIEALECELDETCKRTMFEKLIQDDEFDSIRKWLEVEGIFDDL